MLLPIDHLRYITSLTHEGKVIVFATVEAESAEAGNGTPFTFGKIYYTVRQDGFEDNQDKTAMIGWKHWTLLPFIDEAPDTSVQKREAEDNFLIRSLYRRTGSLGAVTQVQAVSHKELVYVFRTHRSNGHILADRYVLNGLTNELLPKLEVRFKRSRKKYEANAKMKIVNGRLQGVDSLDFRDANDLPFSEPTRQLSFLTNERKGQFAACVVPTTDKDVHRWHFFLQQYDEIKGDYLAVVSARSDRHGQFVLDDQLVISPAEDENTPPVVRSLPGLIRRELLPGWHKRLGLGLAAAPFHIQVEQETKSGPQLLKGAAKLLLAFNTENAELGSLSFSISQDGLLSLLDPDVKANEEMRPSKRKNIFLPLNSIEKAQAIGRENPLPAGSISKMERGENDLVVVHTDTPHNLAHFDRVEIRDTKSYNGHYKVTKLGPNTFQIEKNWAADELGNWELIPEDPTTGLAFEGLITGIEQNGQAIVFTTALDHGLETDLEVLIKNHESLDGDFEISRLDDNSFALSTKWSPAQVINLFLEASKRKGLVFDGEGDALKAEEVVLDAPAQDKVFGHTYQCWVKPQFGSGDAGKKVLISEANGAIQLYLEDRKAHFEVRLPEGIYRISELEEAPRDNWVNYAASVERKAPFAPLELKIFRNGVAVETKLETLPNPHLNFPEMASGGIAFDGERSYANFVLSSPQDQPLLGRDFTMEAWIYPTEMTSKRAIWYRDPKKGGVLSMLRGGQMSMEMGLYEDNGQFRRVRVDSKQDIQKDQWSHVAVTATFPEGQKNYLQWIINGVAEEPVEVPDGRPWYDNGLCLLGKKPADGPRDPERIFEGRIGQFRIWNRVRSHHDIQATANAMVPKKSAHLVFDLLNWPRREGFVGGEGGDWPFVGEVFLHAGAQFTGSPVRDYSITGFPAEEAQASYQQVPWEGTFHFGGHAPATWMELSGGQSLHLANRPSLQLDLGRDSFTFETWLKVQEGGVIWTLDEGTSSIKQLAVRAGQLQLDFGAQDGMQAMPLPELFDSKWHFLSIVVDRTYTQSDDAVARVFLDGKDRGFMLANGRPDQPQSKFTIGNGSKGEVLSLHGTRFWSYQRTEEQIKVAPGYRPEGREKGLVAYWHFEDGELKDSANRHLLAAADGFQTGTGPSGTFGQEGNSMKGILAEVRLWNRALDEAYLKQSLFIPLVGKEYQLAGNWRLGAIWEETRTVTDFSSLGNDAQIYGDIYLSPDSVRRRLGPTDTSPPAIQFRNDDLVAVSQRAVYEESFEYRLLDTDYDPITTITATRNPFAFELRGKRSRSAPEWVEHERFLPQIVSEIKGEKVDPEARTGDKNYGWYRAGCRFVVPDGVSLLRVFGLSEVEGDWHRLEIRKHRLTHISDAITQITFQDILEGMETLSEDTMDPGPGERVAKISMYQSQIDTKRKRISQLEDMIRQVEQNNTSLDAQVAAKKKEFDAAVEALKTATESYEILARDPFNYFWRLKAGHSSKYLSIPRTGVIPFTAESILKSKFTKVTQQQLNNNFVSDLKLEPVNNHQFRARFAHSNYYLSTTKLSIQHGTIFHHLGYPLFVINGKENTSIEFKWSAITGGARIPFDIVTNLFQGYWQDNFIAWAKTLNPYERKGSVRSFRINVEESGLAVSISDAQTKNGAPCIQWIYNSPPTQNQFFYFELQDSSKVNTSDNKRYANPKLVQAENEFLAAHAQQTAAHQAWLNLLIQKTKSQSPEDWKQERDRLEEEINEHYAKISGIQKEYLDAVSALQNTAQALPKLPGSDPLQLITKGAYLGFVKTHDQLSLFENCEGQMQLSYCDHFGRLQQSRYDVTADSENPYFEEWIPDGPSAGLQFKNGNSLKPRKPIPLSSDFTVEWWMKFPIWEEKENDQFSIGFFSLFTFSGGGNFPVFSNLPMTRVVLGESGKLPTIPSLGMMLFRNEHFQDPLPLGDYDDLSKGWHHFAMVKKGLGSERDIRIYVDGKFRFSLWELIEKLVERQKESGQDVTSFKKVFAEHLEVLDDTQNLIIEKIGDNRGKDFFQPQLAELRIWSQALDAEEIAANSKVILSGHEPGLLAYYKMNEGQGQTIRNFAQANSDYDATLEGAASWTPFPPVIGGVLRQVTFFPTSKLALLGNRLPRAILSTKADAGSKSFPIKHISFWVKAGHRMASSRLVSIMNKSNKMLDFALVVDEKGKISVNNAATGQDFTGEGHFPFGAWVHFALNMELGNVLTVYMNGQRLGDTNRLPLPTYDANTEGQLEFGWFRGEMAEFCLRSEPQTDEYIHANYNKPVRRKDPALLAYFPFSEAGDGRTITNLADPHRPLVFDANYGYNIHQAIDLPLVYPNAVVNEYSTVAIDPQTGAKKAMMRRFCAVPSTGGVKLYANKRIEELELLWIGNAQYKPTLLGYMEGAPPVPSENFTVPDSLDSYRGATSVVLETTEDTEYNWTREQEVSSGFDLELFLGGGGDIAFNAPFVGRIKIGEFKAGFQGGLSFAYSFLNSSSITAGSSLITTDELTLTGSPEEKAKFEQLGRRFVPKNVGYALVVSGLADVYVLRLKRSKKMVSYSVQPNEDLPLDINTITFLINPAYTMNGSLDGQTGTQATSQRYFRHVPEMRAQYGSLYPASYFRLWEAYDLKQMIENEDKRRASYFENFNSRLVDETSLDRNIDNDEFNPGAVSVEEGSKRPATDEEGNTLSQQEQMDAAAEDEVKMREQAGEQADLVEQEGEKRQEEIDQALENQDQKANASYQLARWQKKMEDLQIRASKRNIVNTYVWDADGGLRTESQEFCNTVEHTIGAAVSMDAALGAKVEAEVIGISAELTALATVSLTQTLTKTSTNSKGFALQVDLSGVEGSGVTDHDDNPILPGEKVDRYRFMSFYLEGNTKNFYDFFNYVVDPEWLQSNDEEARALRQTQAGAANAAWRILHRVTYVERPALKGFGKDQRPTVAFRSQEADPTEVIMARLRALEKVVLEEGDDNEALRKEVEKLLQMLRD